MYACTLLGIPLHPFSKAKACAGNAYMRRKLFYLQVLRLLKGKALKGEGLALDIYTKSQTLHAL